MRRISLSLLVGLSLLAYPLATAAQGMVRVADTIAGLGTSVELVGVPPATTVDVHVISESGDDTAIPTATDTKGNAAMAIPERLTVEAGTYRVFAVLGQRKITPDATFEVLHDRVDQRMSQITVNDPLLPTDGRTVSTVTVTMLDAQGNPLSGRPVQLVGSRVQDRITPVAGSPETDKSGRVQFTVQTQVSGDITLRAMDLLSGTMLDDVAHITAQDGRMPVGGYLNAQLSDSGQSDVIDHFTITVSTPTVQAKDVIPNVVIEAKDRNERTVDSFIGTVYITTPLDSNSTLPGLTPGRGEGKFAGKNLGKLSFPWSISFSKSGEQTIVVTDETGTIHGQTTVTVTGRAGVSGGNGIQVESPLDGDVVNSREILVKGKGPALRNLQAWAVDGATPMESIMDGALTGTGETDDNGDFAFILALPKSNDVIIEIQDQSGDYDSGPIRVGIDTQGPRLEFTLDPPSPKEGDDVALTVRSEPGLPEVTFKIRQQTITLTESDPGTYEVLFLAPSSGDTEFTVSGRDPAGNITDVQGQFGISGPTLPQVQNVRAEPLARGIQLSWDLIPDDTISGYRIEVGSSPGRAEITLDTPEVTDSASVMGLKAGGDYFVVVRAQRGSDVGPKSEMIAARTLGMEITVTPGDGSLLLQWTFPDSTPLASFLLEYGSPEGEYSEQRTLDGAMRAYTLKDLRAQLYLLRLTPVTITGEVLHDLAVDVEGTPMQGAFHPSADGFPVRPGDVPPDNTLHEGAPDVAHSGLPAIPFRYVLGLTTAVLGIYWYRRRKGMRETRAFLAQMHGRYQS